MSDECLRVINIVLAISTDDTIAVFCLTRHGLDAIHAEDFTGLWVLTGRHAQLRHVYLARSGGLAVQLFLDHVMSVRCIIIYEVVQSFHIPVDCLDEMLLVDFQSQAVVISQLLRDFVLHLDHLILPAFVQGVLNLQQLCVCLRVMLRQQVIDVV